MSFPVNINTQSTAIPKQINSRFNITIDNSWDILHPLGWRMAELPPEPAAGYERLTGVTYIQDPNDPDKAIASYTDTLIQDRLDAEQAAIDAQNAQDIIDNPEIYVYKNVFLLVCDALRGDSAHIKLSHENILGLLLTLRGTDEPLFQKTKDTLSFIKDALDSKLAGWYDSCEWTEVPDIVTSAQTLYNQLMGV